MSRAHRWIGVSLVFVLFGGGSAAAQSFFGLGSIEGRLGSASPEKAKTGFQATGELDLGYLGAPSVRSLVGLTYFGADVDRTTSQGGPISGSISYFGGFAGLRFDPAGAKRVAPYLTTVLTAQNIAADMNDAEIETLVDGFNVGFGLGGGVAVSLNQARTVAVTGDVRRVWVSDVDHWSVGVGVRFTPHGTNAYTEDYTQYESQYQEELRAQNEAQLAREQEAARMPQTTSAGAAESARLEAERQRVAAERLKLEQERLDEERRRAEERRLAAAQAKATQQADSLQAQAVQLQAARQRDAEARDAAELEAAAAAKAAAIAQAHAATADSTLQAYQRQSAKYDKLYSALADADRQCPTVMAVRDTERGLAIVFGQGAFPSGRGSLTPQARTDVGRVAGVLLQAAEYRLSVEGHTDAAGSSTANQSLSEQRAGAVAGALIAAGIAPTRISTSGAGSSQPLADNATAEGRSQNRRVEVILLDARRSNL